MRVGVLLLSVMIPLLVEAQNEPAVGAEPSGARGETYWRHAFDDLRKGFDALESCRARLPDYCSWEYHHSRDESSAEAYRLYLAAKRTDHPATDPLAGKVLVPDDCQQLFDGYPEKIQLVPDPDRPESCLTRSEVLIEAIDGVAAYWEKRRTDLESAARQEAVPRDWRR